MSLQLRVGNPLGHEQITDVSSAVGLTVPTGAGVAVIEVNTQNVRWRDDGTDPTASVGILAKTTDEPFIYQGDLSAIKFFEATAGAEINVAYYGFAT